MECRDRARERLRFQLSIFPVEIFAARARELVKCKPPAMRREQMSTSETCRRGATRLRRKLRRGKRSLVSPQVAAATEGGTFNVERSIKSNNCVVCWPAEHRQNISASDLAHPAHQTPAW